MTAAPYAAEMVELGTRVWGAPNQALSTRKEARFGSNGSKSIKIAEGVWFDHETNTGGGYRDLYRLAHGKYPENGNGYDRTEFRPPAGMLRELGAPVAWWDYHDKNGAIVIRVVRFEPPGADKTFRQCRPADHGWVWKTKGVQVPLYRLPALLNAAPSSLVYITEGEKHADALIHWGLFATTNAGGAKKFQAHHAEALARFRCVILPDCDKAGRSHATDVLRQLQTAGCKDIRILSLPNLRDKGDIIDWIEAGGTLADLETLTAKVPPAAEPAPPEATRQEESQGKPVIHLIGGLRHEAADAGLVALLRAEVGFYQRSKALVRCTSVPAKSSDGTIVQVPGIVRVTGAYLERELGKAAIWRKINKRDTRRIDPPSEVANQILSMEGEWPFLPLRGVIGTQTMRSDGTLLLDEGYDQATGYFLLAPPAMPSIPYRPSRQDALDALDLLYKLLIEFPFVGAASVSVGLSMLITPVLRAAMPVAPCHVCDAPEAGSGKSYLADTASMIAAGDRCPVISMTRQNPEEQEKRLVGAALSGDPIISLDNLTTPLRGDFLCQLTERPLLKPRALGTSAMPTIPNSSTVYANGNNIVVAADMAARRVLKTMLDANVEDTTKRKFFSPSPTERIAANRGLYVAAVLTIARAYTVAGFPDLLTLPSFDEWSKFVRSPLVWLGWPDPVDTMAGVREDDPNRLERTALFSAWAQEFELSNDGYRTAELIEATNQRSSQGDWARPTLRDAALAIAGLRAGGEMQIDPLRFSRWLDKAKGTIADGLKLSVNNRDKKRPRWVLTRKTPT